jgi:hypothetical protein
MAVLAPPKAHADSYGGFEYYFQVNRLIVAPTGCVAEATIDYDGVLTHMATVRQAWLTQNQTTEFYQRHILEIIFGTIDHKAGGMLLDMVYRLGKDKKPDKCHFLLNLAKPDHFGQLKSYPQLSWDFTEALASRIVWDNFDDRNLSKIALNYRFTPEADKLLNDDQAPAPSNEPDRPTSCADIAAATVAEIFGNSPYALSHQLKVLDATPPKPLPRRPNREFACISKLVTNGGVVNVFVEPTQINEKWYVRVEAIP